jgi:hypothetical protein
MKNVVLGTAVCIVILYAIDTFWFDGRYFYNANRMMSELYKQVR